MTRSSGSALVFAGDVPGSWWVVHAAPPRFAGRLLSADEFDADPRHAALVAHGIDAPIPVHFNLGSDVLVITDFIDPVSIGEGDSPQQVILSQAMLDALHRCSRAIVRIARTDPSFAPLAERAEQFLVGWRVSGSDDGEIDLLHAGGAQVRVRREADDLYNAELVQPPADDALYGWHPALLHDRLQRVAGERAMVLLAHGCEHLDGADGDRLDLDAFEAAARSVSGTLYWAARRHDGVCYVALQLRDGDAQRDFRLGVEIDATSPLVAQPQRVPDGDAEAILSLLPMYGLHGAVNLVAAHRHAWFENQVEPATGDVDGEPALPFFPCEVELLAEGGFYAAIAFGPPDRAGLYRLVIAPHAPGTPVGNGDTSLLLPFECVQVDRQHFHLPAYLADGGNLP